MTRRTSYETSAHRRRANPIEWDIDGRLIRLKASADLADLAEPVDVLQAPTPAGVSDIRDIVTKRDTLLAMVRKTFIEPESYAAFDEVAPDLGFELLTVMIKDLVEEYTGQVFTPEQSSSDNSPEAGASLTDGAPLEDLTPPLSPLTES